MTASVANLLRDALERRRDGRRFVACLVVNARGSTPQTAGALMLVDDRAETHGTIGGGCVEAEVRSRALGMLNDGRSGVMAFKLDHDYGWDDGLICGGTLHLAVAPLPGGEALQEIVRAADDRRPSALTLDVDTDDGPARYRLHLPVRPRLYIAGAGHVGQAVARLALRLDYDVTVFDDRAEMMARYLPDAVHCRDGDIAANLRAAEVDEHTSCLVVTRGHRHDEQALEAVVGRGASYVGMIGSRRKVKLIHDDLIARGVDGEALGAVHAPVGLDIGAVSVEEIAIAIAAQLVQVRRRTPQAVVEGPEPAPVGSTRSGT